MRSGHRETSAGIPQRVWWEVSRRSVLALATATIVLFGVLPSMVAYDSRGEEVLAFPSALYAFLFRRNPLVLLFPLVAAVPYVMPFGAEVRHRFLVYTRPRASVRVTVGIRLVSNALVAFVTFFVVGLIPQLFVEWGHTRYRAEAFALTTPEQVSAAEQGFVTFSQLRVYGPWAFPVAFSVWLGVNAVLYSSMALCSTLLVRSRFAALSLPWAVSLVVVFLFAIVGLEAYSPGLLFPFNLTQLPMGNLLYPLASVAVVTTCLVGYTLVRAPSLPSLL